MSLNDLMWEAFRRWTCFGQYKSLEEAWTGLGSKRTYRAALAKGHMTWVNGPPAPRTMGWLKLTPKGVEYLRSMLHRTYTPDHEVKPPR